MLEIPGNRPGIENGAHALGNLALYRAALLRHSADARRTEPRFVRGSSFCRNNLD